MSEKETVKYLACVLTGQHTWSKMEYATVTLGVSLHKVGLSNLPISMYSYSLGSPDSLRYTWSRQITYQAGETRDYQYPWYFDRCEMKVTSTELGNLSAINLELAGVYYEKNYKEEVPQLNYMSENIYDFIKNMNESRKFLWVARDNRVGGHAVELAKRADPSLNGYNIPYDSVKKFPSLYHYHNAPTFFSPDMKSAQANLVSVMLNKGDIAAIADFGASGFVLNEIPYVPDTTLGEDLTFATFEYAVKFIDGLADKAFAEVSAKKDEQENTTE